jgi:hypothetical protein
MHLPGSLDNYQLKKRRIIPEIPPLDPRKVTQRPNMRRLVLIEHDDLDYSKGIVLGSGAFGIVYAVSFLVIVFCRAVFNCSNQREDTSLRGKQG